MKTSLKGYRTPIAFFIFILIQYFFIGEVLESAEDVSPLVFEFFAAVMGSVITVGAMALIMQTQVKHETHKEFASRIFEKKLQIYQDLLEKIFSIDDDSVIEEDEIHAVENQIGVACMVANKELVSILAQYMYQLKVFGVLYFRSLNEQQLQVFRSLIEDEKTKLPEDSILAQHKHDLQAPVAGNEKQYFLSLDEFIQGLREDLAVIDGDVSHSLEHFVRTPINNHGLIPNPNKVE